MYFIKYFSTLCHCYTRAPLQISHDPQFKNPGYKLNSALHFVELQDLRAGLLLCYRTVSQILIYSFMITHCSIIFSRVRNAQPYSGNRKHSRFPYLSTVVDLRLDCAKLVCFCYKFMPHVNIERQL